MFSNKKTFLKKFTKKTIIHIELLFKEYLRVTLNI